MQSGDNCDDCHTTVAWIPANFDHAGIVDNCYSCHNGTDATGKNPTHVNTTNICEDCHSNLSWIPVIAVDHTQVLGSCSSCHNGLDATGKNAGHFVTTGECNVCHETTGWLPHTFQHTTLTYEPLDHRAILNCNNSRCHAGNSETVNWQSPQYIPTCAGCHANEYRPAVDDHNGINNDMNCAQSGCHRITSNEW
jgi:predicted CxxxxCH...CXXCH cytochrome family protein